MKRSPMKSNGPKMTALRRAARGQECTLRLPGCLGGTDTVVLAHIRRFGMGGMGIKPPDWCAVFACAHCHAIQESRDPEAPCGDDDILRALIETISLQVRAGNITTK